MQEFVEGCYILNFNGNPVQQRGIKKKSDFSEIKIDIDRRQGLEEDNEEATCSQEILIVNVREKQVAIEVISDDDDDGKIWSHWKNLVFDCNIFG